MYKLIFGSGIMAIQGRGSIVGSTGDAGSGDPGSDDGNAWPVARFFRDAAIDEVRLRVLVSAWADIDESDL